jgi:hypothetical protein
VPGTQKPEQASVGLYLEAGIVIVFELGPQRQIQLFGNELNFVLGKRAEKTVAPAGRIQRNHGPVAQFVTGQPVTSAPDEVVPAAERDLVLKIKVNSVALLFDDDVISVGPVVVYLEA